MNEFNYGMTRLSTLKKQGVHVTEDAEFLMQSMSLKGHAHSDHDSEFDGDPWDEYNKTDRITSLEQKLSKKLN